MNTSIPGGASRISRRPTVAATRLVVGARATAAPPHVVGQPWAAPRAEDHPLDDRARAPIEFDFNRVFRRPGRHPRDSRLHGDGCHRRRHVCLPRRSSIGRHQVRARLTARLTSRNTNDNNSRVAEVITH